ncbi:hypothetical protein OUZ56_010933 [Daphnia magna]|uniref:Uncharacterized protein n=1 Tax=Daphnia magna TaxID=35525 RepID=A0ABQ9YYT2_9CRUS|nr:hypothetical protein OUZ56_010933 [Daphnia magna]
MGRVRLEFLSNLRSACSTPSLFDYFNTLVNQMINDYNEVEEYQCFVMSHQLYKWWVPKVSVRLRGSVGKTRWGFM